MQQTMTPEKQPHSLKYLFMTEMWERFAYYAVQSVLVLFMTKTLLFSDEKAYLVYAAFNCLLLGSPVVGGYIADRVLGYVNSISLGAVLLGAGYFCLLIHKESYMYFGFALVSFGNGFLKPNISTLLGTFYNEVDPRRERGFTIFYVGINTGGLVGVIASGFVAKYFGWDYSFFIAGLSMVVGLFVFRGGLKTVYSEMAQSGKIYYARSAPITLKILFLVLIAIGLIPAYWVLTRPNIVNLIMIIFGAIICVYIIWQSLKHYQGVDRRKLLVCLLLIIFSIAFWALYQQAPMSLTLYIARDVKLKYFGFGLPASAMWALNPIFIILLTPVALKLWNVLARRNLEPTMPMKFALGIIFMGLGYYILSISTSMVSLTNQASVLWVVLSYAVQTFGELCLSPIGLAMVSLLAPPKLRGMLMGTWFFAIAAATSIAGQLAKIAAIPKDVTDPIITAHIYGHAFDIFGHITISVGVALVIITPYLKRLLNKS